MEDEYSYSDDTEFINGSDVVDNVTKIVEKQSKHSENVATNSKAQNVIRTQIKKDNVEHDLSIASSIKYQNENKDAKALDVEEKISRLSENMSTNSKPQSFIQTLIKQDNIEHDLTIASSIEDQNQNEEKKSLEGEEMVSRLSENLSTNLKAQSFIQTVIKHVNVEHDLSTASSIEPQNEEVKALEIVKELETTQPEKKLLPVTHVIFDLDGTLLDTETINNRIITEIAEEYNKEFTPEIRSRVMGRIASEASITAVQLMEIPMTPEEFDARVQVQNFNLMLDVNLMPGAERLIRHLYRNEVPIAVATSATRANYEIKSTKHKALFSRFHHIVTGGSDPEVIVGKPAPDIYLVCASRFPDKPKPHKCLAIEDSPNGVKAAVNAGMQVVMIPDPNTEKELCRDATIVLNSMEDFRPELFGLPEFET
ncbi:hypothetical protein HHI36_005297 [Cryptolaemus montrouzieri]|uniref:Uncharacterized protein n=1 Tax=Cryptolaemus montrouzieri TaxID=559131 RepID=A0ABD2NUB4_9CUCU